MSERIATVADLVAAREARGLGPDDVMRHLKLAPRQLAALEQGDWAALPGQAFVRGVLRGYGRMLEVDVEPLVEAMSASLHAADLRPAASLDEPLPRRSMLGFGSGGSGSRVAWIALVALGVLVLALFFGGADPGGIASWLQRGSAEAPAAAPATEGSGSPGTTTESVPLVPLQPGGAQDAAPGSAAPGAGGSSSSGAAPGGAAATGSGAGTAATGAAAASGTTAASGTGTGSGAAIAGSAAPASAGIAGTRPGGRVLRLSFDAESWIEARRDGKVVFSGTQAAGSTRELPIDGSTALVIGNAAKVRAEFDGKPLALAPHLRGGSVARLTLP